MRQLTLRDVDSCTRSIHFQLVELPVCLPPVGVFFAAAVLYVVSLPVRAVWKVLPQKKRGKTPKRQAPLPEESSP